MTDDPAFVWDQKPVRPRRSQRPEAGREQPDPAGTERITLREAERRFGVTASTLRNWARKGAIDAVMDDGAVGRKWMVNPDSVAHRLSRTPARAISRPAGAGASEDGAMLVPRDAWDRLMEQLGNLHEAGMRLAEARERAAKAETEATFLRERLAEMRAERDEQRSMGRPAPGTGESRPGPIRRVIDRIRSR